MSNNGYQLQFYILQNIIIDVEGCFKLPSYMYKIPTFLNLIPDTIDFRRNLTRALHLQSKCARQTKWDNTLTQYSKVILDFFFMMSLSQDVYPYCASPYSSPFVISRILHNILTMSAWPSRQLAWNRTCLSSKDLSRYPV